LHMLSYTDVWDIVNRWHIEMRVTRLRNLALLVYGIIQSRSGCLSVIVRHWPHGPTRHTHRLKRLHRFLKNHGVKEAPVFESLAAIIWPYRPGGRRTQLLPVALDWTKVHAFSVLFAAMPRKSRALPLTFGAYHPDRLRHSQNKLERGICTLVASLLPKDATPLFLADAGFGRTEFIRWLQNQGFAFVVRLRSETLVHYRGRTCPLGQFDTIEGWPIILSNVQYRDKKPVTVHIVISRLGDSVWYLGTSFRNAKQTVAWYKKRFWIEEMFRDLKSTLGLRKAHLKDEERLTRLLLGYQIAYLILSLIGFRVPKRWHHYFSSRPSLSVIWLGLHALELCLKRRHRKVWRRHIWPALWLESG
jgi:hypothetical protein